ncbi:MAG: nicotinate-nucleotide pyrophosphorylase (carboxylating) [Alphaproteobacteria bacterium]|jgi:nicotinate-nucleotide pyrophosphorylase (carboxylating)
MRDFYCPPHFYIESQVKQALFEDFGHGFDLTSQTVLPEKTHAIVNMVARQNLTVSGLAWALCAINIIDPTLNIESVVSDGMHIKKGDIIAKISGKARSIMSAERVALNFIGHLSGIATMTQAFAYAIQNTAAKVTCTRKTLPNLRTAQKYAVRCGGGKTHRSGLDDAVLIKDNHIGVCGSVKQAIDNARQSIGHTTKIEIECDTYQQFTEAFSCRADIIMLDNMTPSQLSQCVDYRSEERIKSGIILEASGGVTLKTIGDIAKTGVDIISVGGLTHSAPNADIAFDFVSLV